MHVLIPFKGFESGKSRLSGFLENNERRALCDHLLRHTINLALSVATKKTVHIVTSDSVAASLARESAVNVIPDTTDDLNSALETARRRLLHEQIERLLILPIDLPFATAGLLGEVALKTAQLVIAPDATRRGTNLLLLSGDGLTLPFRFGADSYAAHLAAALSQQLDVISIRDQRLAFDIDKPEHYKLWHANRDRAIGPDFIFSINLD